MDFDLWMAVVADGSRILRIIIAYYIGSLHTLIAIIFFAAFCPRPFAVSYRDIIVIFDYLEAGTDKKPSDLYTVACRKLICSAA